MVSISNSLVLLLFGIFGKTLGSTNRFVSYIDRLNGWWDTAVLEAWGVPGYVSEPYAYNVLILSFYLSSGSAVDALDPWVDPTGYFSTQTMQTICNCTNPTDDSFRQGLMNIYHAHGIKLIMSCFGSTDYPTQSTNPNTLGMNIANFVKQYQLDGVDLDWEDTNAFSSGAFTLCVCVCMRTGLGETWLSNLTSTIRSQLPSSQGYIITHAPQVCVAKQTKKKTITCLFVAIAMTCKKKNMRKKKKKTMT
ncbi:hypothetical protein RFI_06843 [Reticulomyxa filosa]|uniref:Uncharacterized protein n=1 Tax=Reticulomyxa filosa TaxID=46433 RepID=X6NWB3_RETFI|nr:hypothetical protein RFI_06843 [Reticulomyxa filosa]|eukprot:ETO30276.1 hypothetical protein RFI_06843 [Reticulomyxa filosa]